MAKYSRPRQACDYCGSKNNVCFWEYQGKEYSKCQTPDCQYNEQNTPAMVKQLSISQNIQTENKSALLQLNDFLTGEYKQYRGISKEVGELYGYSIVSENGQEVPVGDCYDFDGHRASQKKRYPNKVFPWINHQDKLQLFGLQLFNPKKDECLVITEGFEDAMSVYEAGYAGISILRGAHNAKKDIQDNLDKISKFKKIIVWFDNDQAGQDATKAALEILPLGKTYVVPDVFIWKDANEALQAGEYGNCAGRVNDCLAQADEVIPEGIVFGDQLDLAQIIQPEPPGKEIMFPRLQTMLKGIKQSRIYLIGAGTGCGKSTLVKHFIFPWLKTDKDFKIACIFLEEQQKYTVQSLIGMELGKPVHTFEEDPEGILGQDALNKAFDDLVRRKELCFLDHFGSIDSTKLLKTLEYLAIGKEFDIIILDHISIAISGLSSKEGERKDIDILMTKLKELTTRSKCSIMVVSHLSRPRGEDGYENGKPVTLNSFRGSGSLCQLADVVLSVERNTQHPFDKDKTKLRVLKNRITGMLGEADEFRFLESTGKYFIPEKEFK